MKTIKNGDILWIDLSPLVDKRVIGKYIGLDKAFDMDKSWFEGIDAYVLLYEPFLDEKEYSKDLFQNNAPWITSQCNVVLGLIESKNITIVDKCKIEKEEYIVPDLVTYPNIHFNKYEIKQPVVDFSELLKTVDYSVYRFNSKTKRSEKFGRFSFSEISHLEFSIGCSNKFIVAKLYLEYLKRTDPGKITLDHFRFENFPSFHFYEYVYNRYRFH